MATDLNTLIELFARATGSYHQGIASGTHSTTTLQDNSPDGFDSRSDKRTVGKWTRIITTTDGAAPQGEVRKIASVATSTETVDTAFSAVPTDGDVYEHLPYHPDDIIDAIKQSIRQAYPTMYRPLIDETLVIDNLLANWDFETSTAGPAFTSWASIGTPTLTTETSRVMHGSQSVGIAATGATEGLEQNIFTSVNLRDIVGKSLRVRGFVWCNTASSARLRVTYDGSTFTNSNWHGGSGEWEDIYFDVAVPADATEMTVSCEVEDTVTAYFDVVRAWVSTISNYTIPSSFPLAPHRIAIQQDIGDPTGYYQILTPDIYAPPGHIIRFEGKGHLTVPSLTSAGAGTATTEMDSVQAEFIIANAARLMFTRLISSDPANAQTHKEGSNYWAGETDRLKNTPGARSPRMAATMPSLGAWRINADSTGRYLNLPR